MLQRNAFLIILTLIFITACTTKIISPEERAIERWNALIVQDWEKAYSYAMPSYRKTYTPKAFRSSFGAAVKWQSVELISSKPINDKLKDIKLKVNYTFTDGGDKLILPSVIDERWQLIDNQWWHVKK